MKLVCSNQDDYWLIFITNGIYTKRVIKPIISEPSDNLRKRGNMLHRISDQLTKYQRKINSNLHKLSLVFGKLLHTAATLQSIFFQKLICSFISKKKKLWFKSFS